MLDLHDQILALVLEVGQGEGLREPKDACQRRTQLVGDRCRERPARLFEVDVLGDVIERHNRALVMTDNGDPQ